jgi:hypothetical protein
LFFHPNTPKGVETLLFCNNSSLSEDYPSSEEWKSTGRGWGASQRKRGYNENVWLGKTKKG